MSSDTSGRFLPADLDMVIISHIPFGALNSCARTCRSWTDLVGQLDVDKFVICVDDFADDEIIRIRQFPNGVRHGALTIEDERQHFVVDYVFGQAVTWSREGTKKFPFNASRGRVGSNIYVFRQHYVADVYGAGINYRDGCIVIPNICDRISMCEVEYNDPPFSMEILYVDIRPFTGDILDTYAIDRWARSVAASMTLPDEFAKYPSAALALRVEGWIIEKYLPEERKYVDLD